MKKYHMVRLNTVSKLFYQNLWLALFHSVVYNSKIIEKYLTKNAGNKRGGNAGVDRSLS